MKTLYEKIEIHSESDLPKEEGDYFTGEKPDGSFGVYSYCPNQSIADLPHSITGKKYWLKYIDWYLLPIVQESQPEKTAEEMLDECFEYLNVIYPDDLQKPIIINAMQKFASQSRQTVSDEESAKTFWHLHAHNYNTHMVAIPDKVVFEGQDELWRFMVDFISQSSPNDKAVIAKQAELIEHWKSKPLTNGHNPSLEWTEWFDKRCKIESELKALTSNKE
jgi:hypothetical protein